MSAELRRLNKPEPMHKMLARLLKQANPKQRSNVSPQSACEFRREQYGLTAYQWAALIGSSPSHYSEWLRGKRGMTVSQARKAVLLGVPMSAILDVKPEAGHG